MGMPASSYLYEPPNQVLALFQQLVLGPCLACVGAQAQFVVSGFGGRRTVAIFNNILQGPARVQ